MATLLDLGYKDVLSMEGGLLAWKGLVSSGPPQAGMAYFSAAGSPEEFTALAWSLEEGSRRFYDGVVRSLGGRAEARLFQELVASEELHKSILAELLGDAETGKMESLLPGIAPGELMEGGVRVDEALAWAEGKDVPDILDLSMALEANAYDLYLKMEQGVPDEPSKKVFRELARAEQRHLDWMASLMEREARSP